MRKRHEEEIHKPYQNFTSWKKWRKRFKPKDEKTSLIIDQFLKRQFHFNEYLSDRGYGVKNSVFNAIYIQGVNESFKNSSGLRAIEFDQSGNIILDFQRPSQFDYYYDLKDNERFKYPMCTQGPPATSQINETILELLFQEGETTTVTSYSPRQSEINQMYRGMALLFFGKFIYKCYNAY